VRSNTPIAGPRLQTLAIARGEKSNDPIGQTDSFHQGATDFFVVGTLAGATQRTQVSVQWVPVDAPLYDGSGPINTNRFDTKGAPKFWFQLHRDDSLPPGRYAADVSVDDAAPQRAAFTILPPAPPILARPGDDLPDAAAAAPPSPDPTNLEFIVDASGSMNEPVGDVSKIDAAHQALHALVGVLPTDAGVNVGLRAYSHRSAGANKAQSCQDSELLVPMQGVAKDQLDDRIDSIAAVGEYTPMAFAVQQAARDFPSAGSQNAIVLVSDGKENCDPDPVNAIKAAAAPINLKVHVVGFDVQADAEARAQLQAIAASTGGVYVDAQTPKDLADALAKLVAEQVKVIRPQSTPGQLHIGAVPGATTFRWQLTAVDGSKAFDSYDLKQDLQLAAGTYTMRLDPLSSGSGSLFLVEIGSGQQSVLPLGGLQLVSRSAPHELAIFDEAASRRVGESYDVPKQAVMLPEGHYTVMEKQSGDSDWQVVQQGVEVQQNTIVQVAL
jgi:Mg-chelatase subunit ChlD